jgi:hypothetical protein
MTSGDSTDDCYAFDITLHGRDQAVADGPRPACHADAWGTWPTLSVPRELLALPMAIAFDEALEGLARLERMYVEPDGSFVWPSPPAGRWWQVDGNAFEKDGRVLLVDIKGSCPREDFDRFLQAFGWPRQPLLMQLVRAAMFLDERTFRRHAHARWIAGDGETLRPG